MGCHLQYLLLQCSQNKPVKVKCSKTSNIHLSRLAWSQISAFIHILYFIVHPFYCFICSYRKPTAENFKEKHLTCDQTVLQFFTNEYTFVARNFRHLLKFSTFCTRISPLFGLPRCSPEMISSSFIKIFPSAKSVNKSLISRRACKKGI